VQQRKNTDDGELALLGALCDEDSTSDLNEGFECHVDGWRIGDCVVMLHSLNYVVEQSRKLP
jgi:hypothetical protein